MKKRIILIDDEPDIRTILAEALTARGYETFGAGSGAEARRLGFEKQPDLIISDLQLGDTDGWHLVAEFQKTLPRVPVILLTGVVFHEETMRESMPGNVASCLQKTATLKSILEEVSRVCPLQAA